MGRAGGSSGTYGRRSLGYGICHSDVRTTILRGRGIGVILALRNRSDSQDVDGAQNRIGELSGRERQVLGLAAAGLADKQISAELEISVNTLHTYWARIRQKLGDLPRAALTAAYTKEIVAPTGKKHGTSEAAVMLCETDDPETLRQAAIFYATALDRVEETLARANRAARVLVDSARLSASATSEAELLRSICRVLVEGGGYMIAAVLVPVQDEAKSMRFVASFGDDSGFLDTLKVSWGDNRFGAGVGGTAVRTGLTQINQDFLANPKMTPWRKQAIEHGIQSSIGIPLKNEDVVIGVLVAFATESNAFEETETALLEEIARNLAVHMNELRRAGRG